jgi:hypothetical protein
MYCYINKVDIVDKILTLSTLSNVFVDIRLNKMYIEEFKGVISW